MTDRLTNQPTDRPVLGSYTFKKLFKSSLKFTLLLLLYNIQALQTCFIHVSYYFHLHFIDIIDETDDDTDPPPAPSVRPDETLEDDVTEEEARTEERTAER